LIFCHASQDWEVGKEGELATSEPIISMDLEKVFSFPVEKSEDRSMDEKKTIRIAIFDDHQTIIDGYMYMLSNHPDLQVVDTALYGQDVEPMLASQQVDVLVMNVVSPMSTENNTMFPILEFIPKLLHQYPDIHILVVSMMYDGELIRALSKTGISGYVLKSDHDSIKKFASIVRQVANGGIYFSKDAMKFVQ
jgi:DNA-binding NarL/FixJ family response regulator